MVERSRTGKKGVRFPGVHKLNIHNMERSESIKEIANALCKFQQEVGKVKKDSKNPYFKSKYASLADILDVIQKPLSECGLSIMQMPKGDNELETILMHNSGEWILSSYVMRPVKNDPQSIGSCITYQRRYAIGSILNLNIDDDDDANKASNLQASATNAPKTNLDARRVFLPDFLNNNDSMSKLYAFIEEEENKAKQKKQNFSVSRLMESLYKIGPVELQTVIDMYLQYKKTKYGE
jgi:possible recombination protein, phage associated